VLAPASGTIARVDGVGGPDAGRRVAPHIAVAMLRAEAETSVVHPPGRWVVAVRRLLQGAALVLVLEAVLAFRGGSVPPALVVTVVVVLFVQSIGALTWARGVRAEPVWPQRGRPSAVIVSVGGVLVVGAALVVGPRLLYGSVHAAGLEPIVLGFAAVLVVLYAAEPLRWSRPPGLRTMSWPAGAEEYAVLATAAQAAYIERGWLLECAGLAPMTGGPVVDRLLADGWLRAGRGSRGAARVVRLLPSGRRRHQDQRGRLLAAVGEAGPIASTG
jgi:hypothetical protein